MNHTILSARIRKIKEDFLTHDFIKITENWGLSDSEASQLSCLDSSNDFNLWKNGAFAGLNERVCNRLFDVLKIDEELKGYLAGENSQNVWLRTGLNVAAPCSSTDTFFGKPPLEHLFSENPLSTTHILERLEFRKRIARTS